MDNYEYEFQDPKRKGSFGRTLFIIFFVLILFAAAFFAGALSRGHLDFLPDINNTESAEETAEDETSTPVIAETPVPVSDPLPTIQAVVPYYDIPSIVEQTTPGVVSITTYYSSVSDRVEEWEPMTYGTGVIFSEDGYIVTNHHVIEDAVNITVTLYSGEKVVAQLIGSDKYVDLAVLKINRTNLYNIPFGNSDVMRVGEQVIAIGSPLGDELTGTVTAGIISAVDREIDVDGIPFTLLQTDAALNPGNSGGPLVNMKGEVIGINTLKSIFAGYDEYGMAIAAEGISYAIPSNKVQAAIDDILEYGEILRPFIGVYGGDLSETGFEGYDISSGFYVADVVEGSPAELGGIQAADIIIKIEDKKIEGFSDLYTVINSYEIGDVLTFTVYRSSVDGEIELEITLASNLDFK
jgi:serine protease Do